MANFMQHYSCPLTVILPDRLSTRKASCSSDRPPLSARPSLVLTLLLAVLAGCQQTFTPAPTEQVVRSYAAGVPLISWKGAESRSLATYKWMGAPTLQSGGAAAAANADVHLAIIEQIQPVGAEITHEHESEFVFALDGATTVDWQGRFPALTVAAGSAEPVSPFRGPHTHRNDTARSARWYAVRLLGGTTLQPTDLFPDSRLVYLSPPAPTAAIAVGHVGELRLLTISPGETTPLHRPTLFMVAFVLEGNVRVETESGRSDLTSGSGVLVNQAVPVRFAATASAARMLVYFASASGEPFQEDLS